MSRLLPPAHREAARGRRLARGAGAAVALVLLTLLSMKLASRLVDGPVAVTTAPEPEAPPPEDEPAAPALVITSVEPVHLHVTLDGEDAFKGLTCVRKGPDCEGPTLRFPDADVITVELADLTRARVSYRGTRVEPLGNLSAPRRLVFLGE